MIIRYQTAIIQLWFWREAEAEAEAKKMMIGADRCMQVHAIEQQQASNAPLL